MTADEVPRRLVGDIAGLGTYEAVARSAGSDNFLWVDAMLEPTKWARTSPAARRVAGPAARRAAGRGRRRRQRLPVFLDPMWWVAPRGTRLSRNARSSHRPALVSLGYRSGSDQARWQPVVFRAGELNEDRASRAVDPCEHLLQ